MVKKILHQNISDEENQNQIVVEESTEYDDLIREVEEVEKYEFGYQPPKPPKKKSPYPFTLKFIVGTL